MFSDEQRLLASTSPAGLAVATSNGKWKLAKHLDLIDETIVNAVAGRGPQRLVIECPPRHGKSELISHRTPAWFLGMFPDKQVMLASYEATFAETWGRKSRDLLEEFGKGLYGVSVRTDARAQDRWYTDKGGVMAASGIGGRFTGMGADLMIIDDPIKNAEDARSETIRSKQWDWWQSTATTRLHPGAVVIVLMTRWHEQDLVGYLLEREAGDSPECWHVVNMQAIYDPENMIDLPASCTLEPDWREPGEALCPERYPVKVLREIEQRRGPRVWASLYQQYPRPRDGSMFKWADFEGRFLDAIPAGMSWVAYWDTAGTEGGGDHTAGALVGFDPKRGQFHIADVVRGQWGPQRKDFEIAATCQRWAKVVPLSNVWLEHEAGIGGKDRTKATIAALRGFNVRAEHVTGSKTVRAEVWAAQQEAGNVTMSRGPWNHGFITRSTAFPYSNVDDEQDACSGAFAKVSGVQRGMFAA